MDCTPAVATPKNPAKSNNGTLFAFIPMYNSIKKIAMNSLRLPVNTPNPTAAAAINIDPIHNETATRGISNANRMMGIAVKHNVSNSADKNFQMTYRDLIRGAVNNRLCIPEESSRVVRSDSIITTTTIITRSITERNVTILTDKEKITQTAIATGTNGESISVIRTSARMEDAKELPPTVYFRNKRVTGFPRC